MLNGWIKLHRQFRDTAFYQNSVAKAVWIECLLRASHDAREIYVKREKVTLRPGEFIFGRDEMALLLGEKPSTVWYWICRFESDSMLDIKKTSKGSIASVKNWVSFQLVDIETDNRRTADGQRTDTNKKEKNVKNEKKHYDESEILKQLGRFDDVNDPASYLRSIAKKASAPAIAKAWKEWRRGAGIETPGQFFARCVHWHNQLRKK